MTHELVQNGAEPFNPSLQLIALPQIETTMTAETLLHGDYLPQAVWHTLLSLGWPAMTSMALVTSYQVKQNFRLEQIAPSETALTESLLRTANNSYVNSMAADILANRFKPYLEEWFGPMPSDQRWLNQLAAMIRPFVAHFADAPDIAGWAFPDGWEMTADAEKTLMQPEARPILVSLVAEVAHIVLLDQKTAQTILNGLKKRFPSASVDIIILAVLTGQIQNRFDSSDVMSTLGKAETHYRIGECLR